MTTLPQVSGDPSPNGSSNGHADTNGHALATSRGGFSPMPAIASPVLSPIPGGPGTAAASGLTGADVLRVIRQNLWLIIALTVLGAAIGVGLNMYLAQTPTYTSAGNVVVRLPVKLDPTGVLSDNELRVADDLEVRVANQRAQLTSAELFNKVLAMGSGPLQQSDWMQSIAGRPDGTLDPERALEALEDSFSATPIDGSAFIRVSMEAADKFEARQILEQVVNKHIEDLSAEQRQAAGLEMRVADSVIRQTDRDIEDVRQQLRELDGAADGADGTGAAATLQAQLGVLTGKEAESTTFLQQARDQLQTAQDAIDRGIDPPAVTFQVDNDPKLLPFRNQLTTLETTLTAVQSQLGPNHPTVKSLQSQVDASRDSLIQQEDNAKAIARAQVISGLESEVENQEDAVEDIVEQIAKLDAKLQIVQRDMEERRQLMQNLGALIELKNQQEVVRSSLTLTNDERPPVTLSWANQPQTGELTWPRLPITMGLCTFMGMGLALGAAFLREVLNTNVRTPRDIARVGNLNLLGVIPEAKSDPEVGDNLELAIAAAPHSMTAEQFRSVRSRTGHAAPLETTRTILVTSASPGEGKTTVACNIAAGMALNGRKILLIDANFRKPGVHKVFGFECGGQGVGLSACLEDVNYFDDAVQETSVPNLSVLVAGDQPANPTELIEGANFTDVLDRALEEYDHVIFDSGPILFVSETGALAPQMDGVVSVVNAKGSSRGMLGRLRDTLRSMNVEHLGVVLNSVRAQAGGYYNRNMKTYYDYKRDGQLVRR